MSKSTIFSKYGFIGDNLEIKKNISLEIDKEGKISNLTFEDFNNELELSDHDNNFLMIPGLINSHIHIGDNFAKELGFNRDIVEIVAPPDGLKHKLLMNTSEEIQIKGIKIAISEMLSNGITCFIDFRERSIEGISLLKKALKDIKMDYLILGRFHDETEIEKVFESADGIGLADYSKLPDNIKKKLRENKEKSKKLIACHVAEVKRETNLIKDLFRDDLVDIIIHGTHLNNSDLENLKIHNKSLVLCPRCNGYFGVGFPPILDLIKLRIPFSLGTDNTMANSLDLFEEMRYLYRISRVLCKKIKTFEITSKDLLKMVSINAAFNFKLNNKKGSVSKGKDADLFLIDLNDRNLFANKLDKNNIYSIIVQRVKSENIKKTYIKGEVVFERN